MMRSLWTAKTGLEAQQTQLDAISNNLANVGHQRLQASRARCSRTCCTRTSARPAPTVRADHAAHRAAGRHRVRGGRPSRIFTQGNLQQTGNPLDLAIQGQRLLPGADARRHHRLHARRLVPGRRAGAARHLQRLRGAARASPIPANARRHHRPRRRRQSSRWPGSAGTQVGQMQLADLRQPGRPGAAGPEPVRRDRRPGAPPARAGQRQRRASQGFVETSNVNVVEELVA